MCTLTWRAEGKRYEVHFNRDERRTRPLAEPPRPAVLRGMPYLAPVDPEGGGTWLAVNACGLTVALLNDYGAPRPVRDPSTFRSRGQLVLELVDCLDADELEQRLSTRDLTEFQPFSMYVFTPTVIRAFAWEGSALKRGSAGDGDRPVSSSSRDQAGAAKQRTRLFQRELARVGAVTSELLADFHRSHEPERGVHSPCMHRDDAATVSYSKVAVGPRQVRFDYVAGPPCHGERSPSVALDRAAAAGLGSAG